MDDTRFAPRRHASGYHATSWRVASLLLSLALLLSIPSCGDGTSVNTNAAAFVQQDEVAITVQRLGVGDVIRRGEWAGIRLGLTDSGSRARDVLVRLSGFDPDGDTPLFERRITLTPGQAGGQPVWMYVRVPFNYEPGDSKTLVATVSEAVENGADFRSGRLLGRVSLNPVGGKVLGKTVGMIGVLGRALGLQAFSLAETGNTRNEWHEVSHERVDIATGITPGDLPDRWVGLMGLDTLVWADGDIATLRGESARALEEWVGRGGHLVIVLPPTAQTWMNPASNELHGMMPAVAVTRNEAADLVPLMPLLTNKVNPTFPKTGIVHSFRPQTDAQPNEAIPILSTADGQCVVVRRLVGAGMVTMIGIDLNQTALSQGDNIKAEVLWNRVLGRRGTQTPPRLTSNRPGTIPTGILSRQGWLLDSDIPALIRKSGQAAVGLLAGFAVFAAYWLIAGPIGFAILKRKGLSQHAWVAFVAVGAIFTALAWGGASILRPHTVSASHVSFIDHIFGQPTQRARTWQSILIPSYGEATLEVAGTDGLVIPGERSLNTLAPWDSLDGSGSGTTFPDARGYTIDAGRPDKMRFPVRATVKQIQADWAGGPIWEMPIPAEGGLKLASTSGVAGQPLLSGVLTHKLPGTLKDVVIIVVRGQRPLTPARSTVGFEGSLLANALAYQVSEWRPGETLDLAVATLPRAQQASQELAETFLRRLIPVTQTWEALGAEPQISDGRTAERMLALAMFTQLEPPSPDASNSTNQYAAQRSATHTWDLGRWFTQPCVIIVGQMSEAPSPIPLLLNGSPFASSGTVVVRWVYPLGSNPPTHPSAPFIIPPTRTDEQQDAPATPSPSDPSDPSGG